MQIDTTLAQIPENLSFVQPTKYTFVIPTLPFARYQCQAVSMPGVTTSPAEMETPFSKTYRHGDKLEYEPLTLVVIVDEDLRVWEETYNWLVGLTVPNKFTQYRRGNTKDEQLYHDGILTINSNANIPMLRVKFTDCHPLAVSGLEFDTRESADRVLVSTITFRYDTFSIDR